MVSVLLLVVWIGSKWGWFQWKAPGGQFMSVSCGQITIGGGPPGGQFTGWVTGHVSGGRLFWWFTIHWDPSLWWVDIPLWIPAVPPFLMTAAAWRLDLAARRRQRVGKCPKCKYDLTGLAVGEVCPECGAAAIVAKG